MLDNCPFGQIGAGENALQMKGRVEKRRDLNLFYLGADGPPEVLSRYLGHPELCHYLRPYA